MAGRWGKPRHLARVAGLLASAFLLTALLAASGAAASLPVAVTYEIEALSGNATRLPDGRWLVPQGEKVEWQVVWSVVNTSTTTVRNVVLGDNYSREVEVDRRSINGSRGHVEVYRRGRGHGATQVFWSVGKLPAGASASLTFRIFLGTNPAGKQHYTDPGDYCLDSALTVKWKGGSRSLGCIPVHVDKKQWMRFELPFTRKDWRVRKPGEYTSLALDLRISSNSSVMVQFYGFDDLAMQGAPAGEIPATIATWYAAGGSLAEAAHAGWWRAEELNEQRFTFSESEELEAGLHWYLWERLDVGPGVPSGEYLAEGTIRLILANASAWVGEETP